MLSIVRRGHIYHVRYASYDPCERDRQPYLCLDERHLDTFLHQCRLEPWALQRAGAELQRGGVTVLCVVFSERDVSRLFPLPDEEQGGSQDAKATNQHADAA